MEQKKKKKSKIWIIIGVIVVLFVGCTAALGSGDSESTEEVTKAEESVDSAKEEKVEKDTGEVKEEPEEVVEENQDVEGADKDIGEMDTSDVAKVDNMGRPYFQIGETKECTVNNITLLDLKLVEVDTGSEYANEYFGTTYACAVVELESHHDEVYYLFQDVMLYVDDYQYDADSHNVTNMVVDDIVLSDMPSELSPGRKCKYVYYVSLPEDAFSAEKVEMTLAGDSIPILLKENYVWTVTTDGQ